MAKSIDKKIGTFPPIKPERHLVQVGGQVLRGNLVPASDDATLQERKCRGQVRFTNFLAFVSHLMQYRGVLGIKPQALVPRKQIAWRSNGAR